MFFTGQTGHLTSVQLQVPLTEEKTEGQKWASELYLVCTLENSS